MNRSYYEVHYTDFSELNGILQRLAEQNYVSTGALKSEQRHRKYSDVRSAYVLIALRDTTHTWKRIANLIKRNYTIVAHAKRNASIRIIQTIISNYDNARQHTEN